MCKKDAGGERRKKKKGGEGETEMDIFKSEGLSWADQWDPQQSSHEDLENDNKKKNRKKKKEKVKKIFSFTWIKNLGKKSHK